MAITTDFLASYLEPIAEELTPRQAERILAIKPADLVISRVRELGDKANHGMLTEQERAEYESYIEIDEAIGLLKAKARRLLARAAD